MNRSHLILRINLLILLVFSISISAKESYPTLFQKSMKDPKMIHWVDSVYQSLSLNQRVGQLFMVMADINFTPKSEERLKQYITEIHLGGVLFQKGTYRFQAELTNRLQKHAHVPLMISLDGEWGLAMRMSDAPRYPRNMALGAIRYDSLLYQYGREIGRQCREMGIHINFAPTIDVNNNPSNPVIGTRSFGESPERVSQAGLLYSKGLESMNVLSCAKHFPGHGGTSDDSHYKLPLVTQSFSKLKTVELVPFKNYIKAGLSSIMIGHLNIPALDSSLVPTSFSPLVVTDLLENKMGFKGLKITDGLAMKGAIPKHSKCIDALLAGNDILLAMDEPIVEFNKVLEAVKTGLITEESINDKCYKVLQYKYIVGLSNNRPIPIVGLEQRIHSPNAERINRELSKACITLLKNDKKVLPIQKIDDGIQVLEIGTPISKDFTETFQRYARAELFSLSTNFTATEELMTTTSLMNDLPLIVGIYNDNPNTLKLCQTLAQRKEKIIFCFFISPYRAANFTGLDHTQALIMAYENHPYILSYTAQAVMGGISISGILPVEMGKYYEQGDGLTSIKTRLSYESPEMQGFNSRKLASIDQLVATALKEKALPGCQILVARNGAIIYQKSFGYFDYSNTKEVDNQSIYDLASITKAAATTPAIMLLVDRNKVDIESKLLTYLPQTIGYKVGNYSLKELLTHQTGLPATIPFWRLAIDTTTLKGSLFSNTTNNLFTIPYNKGRFLNKDFTFNKNYVSHKPNNRMTPIGVDFYISPEFRKIMLDEILHQKLTPTNYRYSDLNFILLGRLIETQSHQSLDSFVSEQLFKPLGADRLGFKPFKRFTIQDITPTESDEWMRRQTIQGFVHDEAAAFGGGVEGNAGLFGNCNDLAKLLQMLLNNGKYGGIEYLTNKTCDLFIKSRNKRNHRALGFDAVDQINRSKSVVPMNASIESIGHLGFTGTCFWIDPKEEIIYIFLSNRVHPTRNNNKISTLLTRKMIHEAIYKSIEKP